jgi:hypothetical protein
MESCNLINCTSSFEFSELSERFIEKALFRLNLLFMIIHITPRITGKIKLQSEVRAAHIGCANLWVARSIIQTKQILDSIILNPKISKQEVLDHAWCCTELLLNCEAAHYQIYKETLELMPKCDAIIEESKKRTHIPTLPQVEGLENNVAIFLSSAKRFLEKTHEFLCLFYDAPNSSSNFQTYREWLAKNKPNKQDLIKLLEDDKAWIKKIAFMRNAHDINHAKQGFSLEIENFKLNPGNKCSTPGWRFDFSAEKEGATQKDDFFKNIFHLISSFFIFNA